MALNRIVLVGLLSVGACTSVRQIQPKTYLEDNAPSVVWVTDSSNTVVAVADPGNQTGHPPGDVARGARQVSPGEIRSVEAKVQDRTKTALLLTAMGIAAVSTLYVGFISKSKGAGLNGCGTDGYGDIIQEC